MITLTVKEAPGVPLDAEVLSPDVLVSLSNEDIRALPVALGKRQRRVDDFFTVEGAASDEIAIRGDVSRVKWIAQGMTRGRVTIDGSVGMHLASGIKGGSVEVSGDASDWIGAEMAGGFIRVRGSAGGQVGAAYRGGLAGMTGGTIVIDGSAGHEIGMRMKRGTIAVGGRVKDFAGLQMKGGTILLGSGADLRAGAWMIRGTIVSLAPIALLPTFAYAATYNPTFMRLYAKQFAALNIALPFDERDGAYERYTGDTSVPGKGEILLWKPRG